MTDEEDTPESGDTTDDPDLDDASFDEQVAEARARAAGVPDDEGIYTREEVGLRTKVGWGRSPIVAVVVIVVGLFLLAATWSDFRYFTRSLQSAPRDLGEVTDIYGDGGFNERLDNQWVTIQGDPDVQHAARMEGREGWIGFMRLIEADASLFVALPRSTENATNEFPGSFTGRIRRLDDVPQWEKLRDFFDAEEIIDVVDLDGASVSDAIANGAAQVQLADSDATIELAGDDKLRIVVGQSVAIAQLGRGTWKTQEQAEAVMTALGLPFVFLERRNMVWAFAVWVGPDAPRETYQSLTLALNGGIDVLSADPKDGGLVLPRRATYLVEFGDVTGSGSGSSLSFVYGANTAGKGWELRGDDMVPVELVSGRLEVPMARVEGIRVERLLKANPDGYLVMVGQEPKDVWPSAVMFFAVFGVVMLNVWTLVAALRRRRATALSTGASAQV